MSRMNNRFTYEGNVGANPEIRQMGNSGNRVADVSIAVDSSYRDKDKKKVERTEWIEVSFYSPFLVELVEKYVKKGREIRVEGSTRKQKWPSKTRTDENGDPVMDSRYEFVVTDIKLGRDPNYAGNAPNGGDPQSGRSDEDIPF